MSCWRKALNGCVELDGKEVWKQERTPGIVGEPTDPYWMF
jgi:hypothetical protein